MVQEAEFCESYPKIVVEFRSSVFEALLLNCQFRILMSVVPVLCSSTHSPPGQAASSYPFGFGIASDRHTSPVQAIARPLGAALTSINCDIGIKSKIATRKIERPCMVSPIDCQLGKGLDGYPRKVIRKGKHLL